MMMPASYLLAQAQSVRHIEWTIAEKLPPARPGEAQLGQAGVFAGSSGDVLLVAGGSYFPGKKPWEGGSKRYVANIFALQKEQDGHFAWLKGKWSLKHNKAYGASATTPYGVVCAGGENEAENCSNDAFLLRWDKIKQDVISEDLPRLPLALTNACMAAIGSEVYLAGGEHNGNPSAFVFSINLDTKVRKWEKLPDIPLAMSHAVAVSQSNGQYPCIYIIGGRSSSASGISDLHGNTYAFDPKLKKWQHLAQVSDGRKAINLSASSGVPIGRDRILMIGGDRGGIFHQIELYNQKILATDDKILKEKLQTEKVNLITHHQGFSRVLLVYNTIKNSWETAGVLPFLSHVTTTAVLWDKEIFVTAGEIKPGIRTPDILKGEFPNHGK